MIRVELMVSLRPRNCGRKSRYLKTRLDMPFAPSIGMNLWNDDGDYEIAELSYSMETGLLCATAIEDFYKDEKESFEDFEARMDERVEELKQYSFIEE